MNLKVFTKSYENLEWLHTLLGASLYPNSPETKPGTLQPGCWCHSNLRKSSSIGMIQAMLELMITVIIEMHLMENTYSIRYTYVCVYKYVYIYINTYIYIYIYCVKHFPDSLSSLSSGKNGIAFGGPIANHGFVKNQKDERKRNGKGKERGNEAEKKRKRKGRGKKEEKKTKEEEATSLILRCTF